MAKTAIIQNITQSSLMLGKLGVLRALVTKEVNKADLEDMNIVIGIKKGHIKVLKSLKEAVTAEDLEQSAPVIHKPEIEEDEEEKQKEESKSPVDQKMRPIIHKPKAAAKDNKDKTIKKVSSDNLIIENGVEPGEDEGGIKFVDIEQAEQRIAQHPILSKLNKGK
jgi:protein-tyrosine-phosphatase